MGYIDAHRRGFTLVELLIVIVVIAILVAVSVVAYSGVQNRAYDTAVLNDLKNVAKKFELFKINNGRYPVSAAEMTSLQLRVAKSAYSNGYLAGGFNFAICRVQTDPQEFSLVAASKSKKVLTYQKDGSVTTASAWTSSSSTNAICQATGINSTTIFDFLNLYGGSAWKSYVDG